MFLLSPEEDPDQNALAAWLIRHAGADPPGRATRLTLVAGVLALGLSLLAFTSLPRGVVEALVILPVIVAGIAPLVIAPLTANAIGRRFHPTLLDLLILTNMSGSKLVNGWLAAATHRLRGLLAVLGGSLILLPLAAITLALRYDALTLLDLFSLGYWVLCLAAFATGLWSLSLLAVAIGVRLAFRWREAAMVPAVAVIASLRLVSACLALMITLLWLAGTTSPWLFGGFCIGMSLYLPYHLRTGEIASAAGWVNAHLLHLPPVSIVPAPDRTAYAPYDSPPRPTLLYPP